MTRLIVIPLMLLAACGQSPEADPKALKRQFTLMVEAGASADEQCGKAREIAAAYLVAEDESAFRMADIDAGLICNAARIARL